MKLSEIFKRIRNWWNDQELQDDLDEALEAGAQLVLQNQQLSFLLNQAPMMNAPVGGLRGSTTPFVYVHPKTASRIMGGWSFDADPAVPVKIPGTPTVLIATALMPEYGIIFTSNLMPGFHLNTRQNIASQVNHQGSL